MPSVPGRSPGAVLLDRDGTVIRHRPYLIEPDAVELLPQASVGISLMQSLGLKVVVCSNQSVIGRGMCTAEQVDKVNLRMVDLLANDGASLDAIFYCPHAPSEGCGCRKPATGLGTLAVDHLGIAPASMFVVGDQVSDMQFGKALGARTVLVGPERPEAGLADCAVGDLREAGVWIRDRLEDASDSDPHTFSSFQGGL